MRTLTKLPAVVLIWPRAFPFQLVLRLVGEHCWGMEKDVRCDVETVFGNRLVCLALVEQEFEKLRMGEIHVRNEPARELGRDTNL